MKRFIFCLFICLALFTAFIPIGNEVRATTFVYDNTITWGDSTTERVQIDDSYSIYLNGTETNLVGMVLSDRTPYGAENDLTTEEALAFYDTQLSYLESIGVRTVQIQLSAQGDIGTHFTGIFDLAYQHKMLVYGLITARYFSHTLVPTNFDIGSSDVNTFFYNCSTFLSGYDNIIGISADNEMDMWYGGDSWTVSAADDYMDYITNIISSECIGIPLTTKVVTVYDAGRKAYQDAFQPYVDMLTADTYYTSASATQSGVAAFRARWPSYPNSGAWLGEFNAYNASTHLSDTSLFTNSYVDAAFAGGAKIIYLWDSYLPSGHTYRNSIFFDDDGNPVTQLENIATEMDTWQNIGNEATLQSIAVTPNPPNHLKTGSTQQFIATGTYDDNSTGSITSSVTWVSSNTSVATISSGGLATGVAIGTTSVSCNKTGIFSSNVTLTVIALSSITVTPNPPDDLVVLETQQFTAKGTYTDSSNSTITATSTWVSSNTSVATISSGGLVTAVAVGTTQISAHKSGIYSSNVSLTIIAPTLTSITIAPTSPAHLKVGITQQFSATGHYSNGSNATITSSVTWVSSDNGVASISVGGLATGVSAGTTLISTNMSGVSSSDVTLTVIAVSSVVVTPNPSTNLAIGSHEQFVAKAVYTDSSNTTVTSSATWASSDNSIATISSSGSATGVSGGSVNITATYSGITSSTVSLTILSPEATLVSISVTPSSPTNLDVGDTLQFEAYGTYDDNSTAIITSSVLWVVSDGAIVSVSSDGLATALISGTIHITAFLSGKTSPNVNLTVNSSIIPVVYGGTSGTTFAKSFFPMFVVIIPILLALKMFDGNEHPLTGIFVVMILMIIAIAFLPSIQGVLDGL
jgi:hypothetical protein